MLWPCAVLLHIRRIALGTGQAHYRVKSHVKACIQETMSIYEQSVSVFVSSWLTQAVRLTPSPCLTWRLKDRKKRFKLTKTKRRRFRPHPSLKKHTRVYCSVRGGGQFSWILYLLILQARQVPSMFQTHLSSFPVLEETGGYRTTHKHTEHFSDFSLTDTVAALPVWHLLLTILVNQQRIMKAFLAAGSIYQGYTYVLTSRTNSFTKLCRILS